MPHWLDKVVVLLESETANLRELALLAGEDPRTFYLGVDLSRLDLGDQDTTGMQFSGTSAPPAHRTTEERIFGIARRQRGEERIAILLDEIISNPRLAPALLDAYRNDRSKYVTKAIEDLKSALSREAEEEQVGDILDFGEVADLSQIRAIGDLDLVKVVLRRYAHSFPLSRAALFYFLAKHLAKYPVIKKYLATSWRRRNRSYGFLPYAEEIDRFLAEPTSR
jgi:hypothetical protein